MAEHDTPQVSEKDHAPEAASPAVSGADQQAAPSAQHQAAPSAEQQQREHQEQPGHAPETQEHEQKLEQDLQELTAKAQKADEYLELAQRTQADFENYRKRAVREAASAQDRGVAKLATELLPAIDNLDRALENAEENGAGPLADGIKLVHTDVLSALSRVGIEPFSPQGEQFDPQFHEAVAQQPIEGAEPGSVVEVYQRGYRRGELVLRPARVLVAA